MKQRFIRIGNPDLGSGNYNISGKSACIFTVNNTIAYYLAEYFVAQVDALIFPGIKLSSVYCFGLH